MSTTGMRRHVHNPNRYQGFQGVFGLAALHRGLLWFQLELVHMVFCAGIASLVFCVQVQRRQQFRIQKTGGAHGILGFLLLLLTQRCFCHVKRTHNLTEFILVYLCHLANFLNIDTYYLGSQPNNCLNIWAAGQILKYLGSRPNSEIFGQPAKFRNYGWNPSENQKIREIQINFGQILYNSFSENNYM